MAFKAVGYKNTGYKGGFLWQSISESTGLEELAVWF